MNAEEDEDDPRKINIPDTEGHCEVEGLQIENPNIIAPLKTRQVKIGIEVELKFVKIGDYWNDAMVDKVAELLREYMDFLPINFSDVKGIIGDFGVMKIMLKPDTKPVKERPYFLNPKYKEKVHLELDKMLAAAIIELVEEFD